MAKFFLRTKSKKGMASLYIRVQRPALGVQWWICSGINVDIETWRKTERNTKELIKFFASDKGRTVQDQMNKVEGVINELLDNGVVTCNDDKQLLERAVAEVVNADAIKALDDAKKRKREQEEQKLCVIVNYYDYFFAGISDGIIRQNRNAKTYKEGSILTWRAFGKYLKGYCKPDVTFADINKRFADGFWVYLERQGLMPKTINKLIGCFRKLCNAAAIDEKNKNLTSISVWAEHNVKEQEKRAEIALSDAEIDALYEMELKGVRDQVRDIWMLGFLSGQRVSDYAHLTRENFKLTPNGTPVIVLQQQKTGNDVVVPILDDRTIEICEKYNYQFPRIEPRTLNRYIKEVLQVLAKDVPSLNEMVRTQLSMAERQKEANYMDMVSRVVNGEKLHGEELKRFKEMKNYAEKHDSGDMLWKRDFSGNAIKYKWELVSTHTARRSAVTSMYNTGLYDVRDMMSISGHTSIKNFEGYIKRGAVQQAERIAEKAKKAKEVVLKKNA